MLDNKTPPKVVIFTDGINFYKELSKKYIQHKGRGYFILAPSGSGKTYYVNNQKDQHWIDGDYLWVASNADYSSDEWSTDSNDVQEINIRCDIITQQSKDQGFWIMGSSNKYLKPDAVVLPDIDTHISYIKNREEKNYDGGAKIQNIDGVLNHRKWMEKWREQDVPFFKSINEATEFLFSRYMQEYN